MANIKSQIKRNKTNRKSNIINKSFKSATKSAIKKAKLGINNYNKNTFLLINKAVSLINKAKNKKIYHPNKASRIISKLMTKAKLNA